ncbi:stage II sporulation protein D [Bacillus sp. 2205SS5-2]|uniref:stage II sporulation protein D n=1 Tax=Bacillus sp. 2205SS5-2 TaxID=3109031 RepID=UPI00300717A9
MNNLKPVLVIVTLILLVTLIVPALLVLPFSSSDEKGELDEKISSKINSLSSLNDSMEISVYRTQKDVVESLPIEQYVIGVVSGEMPADFESEALKAQALAARTYIVQQLTNSDKTGLPEGADVTDTVNHQVYKNQAELKLQWGKDFQWKIDKITQAVADTKGQIITYNEVPITATFFSTSNGQTENSEAYWAEEIPYLRSVESPWDTQSPKFESQKIITLADFQQKLGIKLPGDGSVGVITSRTPGDRVGIVKIGDNEFTGREVRDKLGLNSSDFTWVRKSDHIVINTKGYGHGVGMSQYGANGMAKEGKSYEDIVLHYYHDVQIVSADNLLTAYVSQN